MKKEAQLKKWLRPQAVYGYFPCQADGNDLIIYDPSTIRADSRPPLRLTRFTFPRQPHDDHLCLADYFTPVGSNQLDVVAFQVVTVGQAATERFEKFQAENNYSEGYFTHGLAVQTAEATAEYLHQHIRRELRLAEGEGKRYSWGYPAIPELEDHRKVFDLLPVEKELGMQLSPAYQLIPEQSTAAIIVHHPQAKYYTVGESRVDQLSR
jgi:5-methyltetrahydrofolate--homocysteine methyltransferase